MSQWGRAAVIALGLLLIGWAIRQLEARFFPHLGINLLAVYIAASLLAISVLLIL